MFHRPFARTRGRLLALVCMFFLCLASCRTIQPIETLRASSSPDISRVTLTSGDVVTFDDDFGWFDPSRLTIEGTTVDGKAVTYQIDEVSKVEVVRGYAIIPAIFTGVAILGGVIYGIAKLITAF